MQNRDRYDRAWFDTIRPSILKRDGYKCTECKARQRSVGYYSPLDQWIECDAFMQQWAKDHGIKLITVYLQVAHLDQDPSNNDPANLKTFCPRHHLKLDRAHNALKRISRRNNA